MKQIKILLGLILLASVSTFAQSPRIKLNQITKDTVKGSVLISSPTDSGMVYSRDLFISYGADTVLILGGDTIALKSDLVAEIGDSLLNYVSRTELSDSTTNIRTDIPLIIADSLLNYVNISGTQTITGAKSFTSTVTAGSGEFINSGQNGSLGSVVKISTTFNNALSRNWGIVNTWDNIGDLTFRVSNAQGGDPLADGVTRMVILENGKVGIGTTSPSEVLDVNGNARFRSIGSGASAGALHYTSTGVLTTNTSDVRLKTNINPLENTLEKLLNVNTYTFNWINESDRVDLGMIAQEVEEIFPRLVFTNPVDGYKGIHYDKFSSILTKAIQEQQSIIESIQTELDANSSIIESQSNEIETLKTLITDLSNRLQILENN